MTVKKKLSNRSARRPKNTARARSSLIRERIVAAIRKIPRGYVSTYGAVGRAAGLPHAARQVVAVLHRSVGLPWHRVLGAGGVIKLQGHQGLDQRLRLQTEGVNFRGRRVDMARHEFKFSGRKTPSANR